uniref:SFRICE_027000 n=1 Tax=Spodoptera frugiperda TaxID=7108 RepID=A0A2H1WI59_SPOFR
MFTSVHRKTRVEAVVLHAAAVFGACDVNMADNETEENTEKFSYVVGETAMDIICGILFILSLIAFFYGVTSWCLIKKFRHFRNYVMLSAITNALERIYEGEIIFAYYKRGNAASLLGTFPSDSDADEYFDA